MVAVNNKIKAGCLFIVIVWALYGTRLNNREPGKFDQPPAAYGRAEYGQLPGQQYQQQTYEYATAAHYGDRGWDSR